MDEPDEGPEIEVALSGGAADLERLVADGISEDSLAACRELAEVVRLELGLPGPLTTGARIVILRTVLAEVVEGARQDSLASKEQFSHEEAGREGSFRIAAAGELLRIPDPENTFEVIQAYRLESKRLSTDATGSARQRAKLRAALWLGATNVKTAERAQVKVLQVLAAAMARRAREERSRLRAMLDNDQAARSEIVNEDPPAPGTSDRGEPPQRWSKRSYLLAGAAAAAIVASGIVVGIALFDNDDSSPPGAGPTPGPSTTGKSSSGPPLAGMDIINQVKACASLPRDSQAALDLHSRRQAVIDGRCYPDPTLNVGGQVGPSRDTADLGEYATGQILNNICLKSGQITSDMVGSKTAVWVRFDLDANRQAFVSAIWAQGEEGADPC